MSSFHFAKFISAGDSRAVTVAAYANANWTGPFAGLPAANRPVTVRDIDYYVVNDSRIVTNWCMVDVVDILQQVGYKLLPPAPLPNLGYKAPSAMDGLPAPIDEYVKAEDSRSARALIEKLLVEDYIASTPAAQSWSPEMTWYGPPGVGTAKSPQQYLTHWLKPLRAAFADRRLEVDVVVCESVYCGAHVHLVGKHVGTWLGRPATQAVVSLRMGLHWRVDKVSNKIAEGWCQVDLLSAFGQMGQDLLAVARAQAPLNKQ
jgi:predicted ester cyclase